MPPLSPGRPLAGLVLLPVIVLTVYGLAGGHPSDLMNAPSLIVVLGGVFATILMGGNAAAALRQLPRLLLRREEDFSELHGALKLAIVTGPTMGLLSSTLGLIEVMNHLSDPSKLGAGIAVALLSLLLGVFIGLVAFTLSRLTAPAQARGTPPERSATDTPEAPPSPESEEAPSTTHQLGVAATAQDPTGGAPHTERPILGFLTLIVCMVLGHGMAGGSLRNLFAPLPAMMVLGIVATAWLMACGLKGPLLQAPSFLRGAPEAARDFVAALQVTSHAAPLAGLVAVILGLILSLVNLSEAATLGKGLSTALLGLLYGTLLGVSSLSLQAPFERTALARTGPAPAGSTIHAGFSILFAATGVAFVLAAFFTVMYATAPSCP